MWMFPALFSQHVYDPLATFICTFMKEFAKLTHIEQPMGGNDAMFNCVLMLQRMVLTSKHTPLMFGSALLGDSLMLCLLLFCFFSTSVIFAHADWMKN